MPYFFACSATKVRSHMEGVLKKIIEKFNHLILLAKAHNDQRSSNAKI